MVYRYGGHLLVVGVAFVMGCAVTFYFRFMKYKAPVTITELIHSGLMIVQVAISILWIWFLIQRHREVEDTLLLSIGFVGLMGWSAMFYWDVARKRL